MLRPILARFPVLNPTRSKKLSGGFGAEYALEAGAGELDADEFLASGLGIGDVDNAAMGGEVRIVISGAHRAVDASRSVLRKGDADFEVGPDRDVETCDEGGAVAAKIFAGGIFFEGETAGIAAADFQRQADSDSTFRALLRTGGARERDHGLGPRFW